jgi:hypothetical protein
MSGVGKYLAASKGKGNVKASVNTALKTMFALEEPLESDVIELVGCNKSEIVEDWGVDDVEHLEVETGSNLVIGSHLNLISEEDVSLKKCRKGPKKWGDFNETDQQTCDMSQATNQGASKKKEGEVHHEIYRPPQRMRENKIDVGSHQVFPELDFVQNTLTSSAPVTQVTSKNKKTGKEERLNNDTTQHKDLSPSNDTESKSYMVIEEFLKDIKTPSISVTYDDEASKNKFLGRKKRPVVTKASAPIATTAQ